MSRRFNNCLAITVIAVATACSNTHTLSDARRLVAGGELEAAQATLDILLEHNPLDAEALLLLAEILIDRGDGRAAERELRKAAALGMGRDRIDRPLAKALLLSGEPQRVLQEIQPDEAHRNVTRAGVLTARGMAHLALEQPAKARAAFAQALEQVPDFAEALLAQARLTYLEGDASAAAAALERVLKGNPRLTEAWLLSAELLHAQGHAEQALQAYEQAIELAPDKAAPRLAAARLLLGQDRLDQAQRHLDRVLRLAPGHPLANYTQALIHFQRKDYVKAQQFVQEALELAPRYAPASFLLAAAELAQGGVHAAEQRLRLIAEQYPHDLFARKLYVAALLQINQHERAIEMLEPLVAAAVPDSELHALAGQAYTQARQFTQANAAFEQAVALQNDAPSARLRIGLLQMASGAPERGITELEKAAGLETTDARADVALALTHLRRKELDRALRAAATIEHKQPGNPIGFNLSGVALLAKGDPESARARFEQALSIDASYLPAAINLALLDIEAGAAERARTVLERVLATDPANVDALVALAHLDAIPEALVERLQRARIAAPNSVAVRLMLIREHLAGGRAQEAVEIARETLTIAPDHPEALDALGAAQMALGQRFEAVLTYEHLTGVVADSASAHFRLAQAYAWTENHKAAEREYRKAIGLKPDHVEAIVALARLYMSRGHFAAVAPLVADLKLRSPASGAGEELQADMYLRQQRYAEAARAYEAALVRAPRGELLVKHHGALEQAKLASGEAALARIESWVHRHHDDVATRHYLADRQLEARALEAAIENYRRVVDLSPRNGLAFNNLAHAYALRADPRALDSAEQAYALLPEHPEIADTLGWLLIQAGQQQRGLELLRKAAAARPDSAEIGLHFAIALARTGDKQAARAVVKRMLDAGADIKLDAETRALLRVS